MTPEQLDAIQARYDGAQLALSSDAGTLRQLHRLTEAANDVPALLAYARDLEARIGRVEALCEEADDTVVTQADGVHVPVYLVRAALTATEAPA